MKKKHLNLPNEAIVQLERPRVGNACVELIASVQVVERAETQEVYVHVETAVSKQDLEKTQGNTKKYRTSRGGPMEWVIQPYRSLGSRTILYFMMMWQSSLFPSLPPRKNPPCPRHGRALVRDTPAARQAVPRPRHPKNMIQSTFTQTCNNVWTFTQSMYLSTTAVAIGLSSTSKAHQKRVCGGYIHIRKYIQKTEENHEFNETKN